MLIPLFRTHELQDDAAKGIEVQGKQLFAVRKKGEIFLYWNRCPHIGTPLEWEKDKFLDTDKALIQCATHGALFEIGSGRCLVGPCRGKHLKPVPFELADGTVSVA
jgi:nitrite reductase/ring-hydroxylating ferredoxin subunit